MFTAPTAFRAIIKEVRWQWQRRRRNKLIPSLGRITRKANCGNYVCACSVIRGTTQDPESAYFEAFRDKLGQLKTIVLAGERWVKRSDVRQRVFPVVLPLEVFFLFRLLFRSANISSMTIIMQS